MVEPEKASETLADRQTWDLTSLHLAYGIRRTSFDYELTVDWVQRNRVKYTATSAPIHMWTRRNLSLLRPDPRDPEPAPKNLRRLPSHQMLEDCWISEKTLALAFTSDKFDPGHLHATPEYSWSGHLAIPIISKTSNYKEEIIHV